MEAGTIDQSQADAVIEALVEAAPEGPRHGPRGGQGLEAAAEAIGVERSDLMDALRDGSTIAEVAEANGVDAQTVIDAMVAEAEQHIAEGLENGRLTEERAAEIRDGLTERITELVNSGPPEEHEGWTRRARWPPRSPRGRPARFGRGQLSPGTGSRCRSDRQTHESQAREVAGLRFRAARPTDLIS
ncbi:MAG: hypothetical protein R2716_08960 [Microthrixaceae bacterium]